MKILISLAMTLLCTVALAAGRPAPAVTTMIVNEQSFENVYYTQGVLQPYKSIEIRSEVSGIIVKAPLAEGLKVAKDELVLELDKRQANANLSKLNTELELSAMQLNRQEKLVASQSASLQTKDQLMSQINVYKSNIEIAKIDLEKLDIRAPFAGTIDQYDWVSGQWLPANSVVATLSNLETLKVNFSIPERYFSLIDVNSTLSLKAIARPNETFEATVSAIGSKINNQQGTVDVEAEINNDDGYLLPGMSITIAMPLGTQHQTILIPARSVTYQGQNAMVMLVDESGVATPRNVTIGAERETLIEIVEGLSVGDKIIDRGRLKAKPNKPVKEIDPSRNAS